MKALALTIPQYGEIKTPAGLPSPQTINLQSITNFTVQLLVIAGIVVALIFIIYSGITWITSGGDKQKVEKARNTLTYSLIGLIIIILSFVIIRIIGIILGSEFLINFGQK